MLGEKTLLIFRNSSALRTTRDVWTEFLAMKWMPMVPTDIVVKQEASIRRIAIGLGERNWISSECF